MIGLKIILEGDGAFSDIPARKMREGNFSAITGLPDGTESGKPTICIRVDMVDGTTVLAQTTLALFLTAADAFKARYGDPRL